MIIKNINVKGFKSTKFGVHCVYTCKYKRQKKRPTLVTVREGNIHTIEIMRLMTICNSFTLTVDETIVGYSVSLLHLSLWTILNIS